jgi:hypothetical protein
MDSDYGSGLDWGKIAFPMPEPELHQVLLSWHTYPSPCEDFSLAFGTPKETRRGFTFPDGIFLTRYHKLLWHIVKFNADDDILNTLSAIVECYPLSDSRKIVQLYSTEVMWNFPFPNFKHYEIKALMREIAQVMVIKETHVKD